MRKMFSDTYAKFYTLMALALIVGFLGMEVSLGDASVSGLVIGTVDDAGSGVASDNLPTLLLGLGAGALLVAGAVYLYVMERRDY